MSAFKPGAAPATTGFSLKQFAHKSALLTVSLFIRLTAQLIVLFVYSRKLNYQDYGTYQSVWLYSNILSTIGLFGLPSLIYSTSSEAIRFWVSKHARLFAFFFAGCNLIPLCLFLFLNKEFTLLTGTLLSLMIFILELSTIAESIVIKQEKEKQVVSVNLIYNSGYLLCHLLILYTGYSLALLLGSLIILLLIKIFFLLRAVRHAAPVASATAPDTLGKQWLYLGLNESLSIVYKWYDKWLILFFVSVAQFAVYFNGAYEIPVFALLLSAVGNIMLVQLSKSSSDPFMQAKLFYTTSSTLLASLAFPCFGFLLFYCSDVFTLLFSHKYDASIPIFRIGIFIIPVRITSYTVLLQVHHKSNLILKGAVLDLLLASCLMFLFYPLLGMKGLILSVVISTYLQSCYYLWESARIFGKRITDFFPLRPLLLLLAASIALPGIVYYYTRRTEEYYSLAAGFAAAGLLSAGWLYLGLKRKIPLLP